MKNINFFSASILALNHGKLSLNETQTFFTQLFPPLRNITHRIHKQQNESKVFCVCVVQNYIILLTESEWNKDMVWVEGKRNKKLLLFYFFHSNNIKSEGDTEEKVCVALQKADKVYVAAKISKQNFNRICLYVQFTWKVVSCLKWRNVLFLDCIMPDVQVRQLNKG
jgi:hypothetical protein